MTLSITYDPRAYLMAKIADAPDTDRRYSALSEAIAAGIFTEGEKLQLRRALINIVTGKTRKMGEDDNHG